MPEPRVLNRAYGVSNDLHRAKCRRNGKPLSFQLPLSPFPRASDAHDLPRE